jgi:hypothetical protein
MNKHEIKQLKAKARSLWIAAQEGYGSIPETEWRELTQLADDIDTLARIAERDISRRRAGNRTVQSVVQETEETEETEETAAETEETEETAAKTEETESEKRVHSIALQNYATFRLYNIPAKKALSAARYHASYEVLVTAVAKNPDLYGYDISLCGTCVGAVGYMHYMPA